LLIGKRFEIVTYGGVQQHADRIPIIYKRGKAFGSGDHETTRSCFELMELYADSLKNAVVLDVGTGTGILGTAALKLGARKVIAVDTSGPAADTAAENIRVNGFEDRMTIIQGEISCIKNHKFDFIIANIQYPVLLQIAEDITDRTADSGYVLLSGIILDMNYDVRMKYSTLLGADFLKQRIMEDYATILFQRT